MTYFASSSSPKCSVGDPFLVENFFLSFFRLDFALFAVERELLDTLELPVRTLPKSDTKSSKSPLFEFVI